MIDFSAMTLYVCVSMVTPGPNNLMTMYLSANYGMWGSRRFMVGSGLALLAKMFLCGLLNLLLASVIPAVMPWLKWLGAAYMLYLAIQMARSGFQKDDLSSQKKGEATALSGVLLQCLNIKSWVFALSVFSVYVMPFTTAFSTITMVSLISFAAVVLSMLAWGLFGSVFQKLYARYRLLFSLAMAASLVFCAVTAVL